MYQIYSSLIVCWQSPINGGLNFPKFRFIKRTLVPKLSMNFFALGKPQGLHRNKYNSGMVCDKLIITRITFYVEKPFVPNLCKRENYGCKKQNVSPDKGGL